MTELFIYLIKAAIVNAVILAFYYFTLRKSDKFQLMRATLLLGMILPLILPLIPYPFNLHENSSGLPVIAINLPEAVIGSTQTGSGFLSITALPATLYYGVCLVLIGGMLISVASIIQKKLRSKEFKTLYGRVELERTVKSPFSFFSWVFLSPNNLSHPQLDMILKHEFCHVREKHSVDRLLSGIFRSVLWFSPFAHITSRLLSEVHEYQADSKVIGIFDRGDYSDLILSFYLNNNTISISNNFSLHIKKRITMINNLNFSRIRYGRIFIGLCLSLSLLFLTSMVTTTFDDTTSVNYPDTTKNLQQNKQSQNDKPDTPPQFPGGDKALVEYLAANTPYPEDARKAGIEGTVYVQFTVYKTGEVGNILIKDGVNSSLAKVANDAVRNMPKWKPAMKDNKPVSYGMTLPIKFALSDKDKNQAVKQTGTTTDTKTKPAAPQKGEKGEVFTVVEVPPQFPGGDEARANFMASKIVYPDEARKKGIQGTVYLTFIVQADGSVTNMKIIRGVHELLDKAALEAASGMPKWEPGKMHGEPVAVQFNMPVKFSLEKDAKKSETNPDIQKDMQKDIQKDTRQDLKSYMM
ncbi:MAG TPA: M56 family metallopeptidase [Lentimicrobium sp.]|nr:M56 family metallopeptidase [Lentimicrobium sp.]